MSRGADLVPRTRRVFADQLTPVLGYRRLVSGDQRLATSFLLESVETGGRVGRWSFVGAAPARGITARGHTVEHLDAAGRGMSQVQCDDPLDEVRAVLKGATIAPPPGPFFCGGWCGWIGYDAVRWLEPEAVGFAGAPVDDRGIADMHLGLYLDVLVFDHVDKTLTAVSWADRRQSSQAEAEADARIDAMLEAVESDAVMMPPGRLDLDPSGMPADPGESNMTRQQFEAAVERCKDWIRDGDIFQVVPSQRFERHGEVDPFAVYRALRVVNPSPYMLYMQGPGAILIASSPEILCRVEGRTLTSRPLAGTRRRGEDDGQDKALETDLRGDDKERSEHSMLVDLARNDIGTVCSPGSVQVERLMDVERYRHVMHLSSTVTGTLKEGHDAWDALRHSLPVGTVSGAPKIRAMQIIDELEPTRRGPFGGGIGCMSLHGDMDMAIALRTIVVPADNPGPPWTYHLQAGAGIVLDSVPAKEFEETIAKAASLSKAIDLAADAFVESTGPGQGAPR
ncbi:MAG: chorismate-binding protein [Phycisphaerales bacterium]|nr:chorismate-binding protein [Phycisphaerales bacterium]